MLLYTTLIEDGVQKMVVLEHLLSISVEIYLCQIKLETLIDINQDEICQATSKSFHGSSVQTKDVMSEKI